MGKQHDAIPFMQAGRKTLADDYQYIMHGKLYKISEDSTKDSNGDSSTKVWSVVSLLIKTDAPPSELTWRATRHLPAVRIKI